MDSFLSGIFRGGSGTPMPPMPQADELATQLGSASGQHHAPNTVRQAAPTQDFSWMSKAAGFESAVTPAQTTPAAAPAQAPAQQPPQAAPYDPTVVPYHNEQRPQQEQEKPLFAKFAADKPMIPTRAELKDDTFSGVRYTRPTWTAADVLNTPALMESITVPQELASQLAAGDMSGLQQFVRSAVSHAMISSVNLAIDYISSQQATVMKNAFSTYNSLGSEHDLRSVIQSRYQRPEIASLIFNTAQAYRTQYPNASVQQSIEQAEAYISESISSLRAS